MNGRAAIVSLTTLAMIVLVVAVMMTKTARDAFSVEVVFSNAGGLKPGDNVLIRGLAVGQVQHINLIQDHVIAVLSVRKSYASHLDENATFKIVSEKLITGKKSIVIVPGSPPGPKLIPGARVRGLSAEADPIQRAQKALDDSVAQAGQTLKGTVDHAGDQARELGRAVLNPDRHAPRTTGATIDLDRPGQFLLQIHALKVHGTTADGSGWDTMGEPDLLIQVWVDRRQVLMSGPYKDRLGHHWKKPLKTEPFDLTPSSLIQVKVLDVDTSYNDEIGVAELRPTSEDALRSRNFRLAAGRIKEIKVSLASTGTTEIR